ncbi:hypothetical protein [Burkholderia cepacia]|uniref:hypothetical protein n=1 Tax=Burkholderia cepacia TaxID=292 RepID=UPI003EE19435
MKKIGTLLVGAIAALLVGFAAYPEWNASCSGSDYSGLHANPPNLSAHPELSGRHLRRPIFNGCEFTADNPFRRFFDKSVGFLFG